MNTVCKEQNVDVEIDTKSKCVTIVEFMGGVYGEHPLLGEGYFFYGEDESNSQYGSHTHFISIEGIMFYSYNWNWLISVICKIKVSIKEPSDEYGKLIYNNIFNGLLDFFYIGLTFLEVHSFIEWHNQNKK